MFLSVRIAFEPNGRTDAIGTFDEGQFMLARGVLLRPGASSPPSTSRGNRRVAAVLHRFDREGRHRETSVRWAGDEGDRESYGRARILGDEMLGELSQPSFGDIRIRPFDVVVDDVRFALARTFVVWPPFFEYELRPYDIFLGFPFDGTYDT